MAAITLQTVGYPIHFVLVSAESSFFYISGNYFALKLCDNHPIFFLCAICFIGGRYFALEQFDNHPQGT
jgi:hypothetical protein